MELSFRGKVVLGVVVFALAFWATVAAVVVW